MACSNAPTDPVPIVLPARSVTDRMSARLGLVDAASGQTLSVEVVNTDSNSTRTLQALLRAKGWLEEQGLSARTLNVSDGSKLMAP